MKTGKKKKRIVLRYQLPYIRQHQQCAPRHEAQLCLQILSHGQPEIHHTGERR